MTPLTRRPYEDGLAGWHVYFGDVRIGNIRKLSGVPTHGDQWGWSIGFYPGMNPSPRGDYGGSAATFEDARAAFETHWKAIEPTLTEEQYEVWRHDRDWTAWKYRMWKEHLPMPTQTQSGRSRCFCGAELAIGDIDKHVAAAHQGIGA